MTVEADIHSGLPAFTIVGLPDAAVQESRERVRAALLNSGFDFPLRRITVNLAPADLRKAGPGFDLALAAAVLAASGQVPQRAAGVVRAVRGAGARRVRARSARLDRDGAGGARGRAATCSWSRARTRPRRRWSTGSTCRADRDAARARAVPGRRELARRARRGRRARCSRCPRSGEDDFRQLRGHHALRRALEVAAAGGHNLLMVGPPGSGKSMAARRLPSILPPLTLDEALAVTRVHSVAGVLGADPIARTRPFRAPHHSISAAGLVGGGRLPAPGEASLAQHGVLFLDELAEFSRPALEALRQPLEEGSVRITRAQRDGHVPGALHVRGREQSLPVWARGRPAPRLHLPGAGAGPLPGEAERGAARPHRHRAAGRAALARRAARGGRAGGSARDPRARDRGARAPAQRLDGIAAACNGELGPAELRRLCRLDGRCRQARISAAHDRGALTMRGHDRAMRVARTLADLDGCDTVRAAPRRRRRSPTGCRHERVCARCLRRAALLGRLVPWIERALNERRGVPELLALVEREADRAVCGDKRGADRRVSGAVRRRRGAALRRWTRACGPCAGTTAAIRSPLRVAARCSRRPVPEGGRGVARAAGGRAAGGDRRFAAGVGVRETGRVHARPRACGARRAGRQRPGVRRRRRGARGRARGRRAGRRRDAVGRRLRVPALAPRAAPRGCAKQGLVVSELPPGTRPLQVVLSGAQPHHGRARAHDGRGRGHRDLGLADHGAVRPATSGATWAPFRARSPPAWRPGPTRCWPTAPASCARRRTCSTRCTAWAQAAASTIAVRDPLEPRLERLLRGGRGGPGRGRDRARRARPVGEVLAGLTELELLGLVRRGPGGAYVRAPDGAPAYA